MVLTIIAARLVKAGGRGGYGGGGDGGVVVTVQEVISFLLVSATSPDHIGRPDALASSIAISDLPSGVAPDGRTRNSKSQKIKEPRPSPV